MTLPKMSSNGFGFLFGADVGEVDYRERCRDNILAALEAEPLWDGVFLDDVNSTLAGHRPRVDGGRHEPVHERLADGSLEQRPYEDYLDGTDRPDPATDEEWELRVGGLLETVGGAVRARERLVIANFCCEERNEAWGGYLDHVAGGLSEFFVKYPPPSFGVQSFDDRSSYRGASDGWAQQLSLADEAERRNKWFLGGMVARPDDERAARWGVANLMLVSRGRSSLQLAGRNDGLNWPHCDGFKWPHLVRSSVDDLALIERGSGAGRKWDPEWSSSSRSGVIVSARGCRSGRWRSGMGCIGGWCAKR